MIHVFIGTKAQYIKTAPLLRLMDEHKVEYRLIDSGQHGTLSVSMRQELGVREPDVRLGGGADVTSIPRAIGWAVRLGWRLLSKGRLRAEVFGDEGGVCVVHGDTPSTLLSALMAKRAGLSVAHLEAGLRSRRWFHPFPEELIRMIVMRRSDLLFAPDGVAAANLEEAGVKGRVVLLEANTSIEAVAHAARPTSLGGGSAVATMHRVENLHRATRRAGFVRLVEQAAQTTPVRFLVHQPTRQRLSEHDFERLQAAGVTVSPLVAHDEFIELLAAASFVITDGGSVQEECALLGVPTLLWREHTERPDGIGGNVVLSGYDEAVAAAFLASVDDHRRAPAEMSATPSGQILETLLEWR